MLFSKFNQWIVLVLSIGTAPFLNQQPLDDNLFPREMMGIFIGDLKMLSQDKTLKELCIMTIRRPERKFAYFYLPVPCNASLNLSVVDFLGSVDLARSHVGGTFKIECIGKGQGYHWINVGDPSSINANYTGLHSCGVFERDGDMYYWTSGFFASSPIEAKCPPSARTEPLVDPLTMYKATLKAIGEKTRNLTQDMYTCQ